MVDLHLHFETRPRLERLLDRRAGRTPRDWRLHTEAVRSRTPPGLARLCAWMAGPGDWRVTPADFSAANFEAGLAEILTAWRAEGATYVEVRLNPSTGWDRHDWVVKAFRRAILSHSDIRAGLIGVIDLEGLDRAEIRRRFERAAELAGRGLCGIDVVPWPYDEEAPLGELAPLCRLAADAGLGITCHAGEFSPANVGAALELPGLTRLGHAVAVGRDAGLLREVVAREVHIECCLTANVILGAVPSYDAHPLPRFLEAGVSVSLNTDDPILGSTSIGREYALAKRHFGLCDQDLRAITAQARSAAFGCSELHTRPS